MNRVGRRFRRRSSGFAFSRRSFLKHLYASDWWNSIDISSIESDDDLDLDEHSRTNLLKNCLTQAGRITFKIVNEIVNNYVEKAKQDRNNSQMQANLPNNSVTPLSDQRRSKIDIRNFKTNGLTKNMPNEVWVDCLKFLKRDDLEKFQLVSVKHDLLVHKYFSIYPLRKVKSCKISLNESGETNLCMVGFSRDGTTQRIIESDFGVQLWLRNCYIETCGFYNFTAFNHLIHELSKMSPEMFALRHCIFDYSTEMFLGRVEEFVELLKRIFTISTFLTCKGAIFSFQEMAALHHPPINSLLSLPLSTIVIDFEGFPCSTVDLTDMANWLCHEPIYSCPHKKINLDQPKNLETRTLSLKHVIGGDEEFEYLVQHLKKVFKSDKFTKRPFILQLFFDLSRDWNLEFTNYNTNEQLRVTADVLTSATIQRFSI